MAAPSPGAGEKVWMIQFFLMFYGSYMAHIWVSYRCFCHFLPRWFHIHSLKLKLSSEIHVSCMGCYGNLCIESLGFAPQSTIQEGRVKDRKGPRLKIAYTQSTIYISTIDFSYWR